VRSRTKRQRLPGFAVTGVVTYTAILQRGLPIGFVTQNSKLSHARAERTRREFEFLVTIFVPPTSLTNYMHNIHGCTDTCSTERLLRMQYANTQIVLP